MIIDIKIEDYLNEDEIKEAIKEGVVQYTKEKCQKFFDGCDVEKGEYRTLFETVCLNYMLDNYRPQVELAVDACLEYITTTGIFKPRWYDNTDATRKLFAILQNKLAESSEEFKNAILERIKNTDEDILREILIEVVNENLSKIFN
jgi:hypothetical protein